MIISAIFIISFTIRIIEGPLFNLDKSIDYTLIPNSIWNVVVTMTTVGYGDLYPKTILGRTVLVITTFLGTIIISLLVAVLTNFMRYSENQRLVSIKNYWGILWLSKTRKFQRNAKVFNRFN